MKIVIPGGSGQVGIVLAGAFHKDGHDVTVLSRGASGADGSKPPWRVMAWDARTLGDWASALDGTYKIYRLRSSSSAMVLSRLRTSS